MKYREILKNFDRKYYNLLLEFAEDLMSLIDDEDLLDIYETYPEIFSALSQGQTNIELIQGAIAAFVDFLQSRENLEEELSKLDVSQLKSIASDAIYNNDACTIKALINFKRALS